MKIKSFTLTAGTTVGVFATLGVTVAPSYMTIPAVPNVVMVDNSGGTGAQFPIDTGPFHVNEEIYIKNMGGNDTMVLIRLLAA